MSRLPTIACISITVLTMALAVDMVSGNLIELAYKVVNLLAAPLGGIVLTALYLPRTRPAVAWCACMVCVAVVVYVNYLSSLTFLLAAPLGLSVQVGLAYLFGKDTGL